MSTEAQKSPDLLISAIKTERRILSLPEKSEPEKEGRMRSEVQCRAMDLLTFMNEDNVDLHLSLQLRLQ